MREAHLQGREERLIRPHRRPRSGAYQRGLNFALFGNKHGQQNI